MSHLSVKAKGLALPLSWGMPMTDDTDRDRGLARAALALTTAIANEVRKGAISLEQAKTVFKTARWLVHDVESFPENDRTAQTADSFLTVSEAVARHKLEQGR